MSAPRGRQSLLTGWGRTAPTSAEVVHAVHTDIVDQAMAGAAPSPGVPGRGIGCSAEPVRR